jgi:proline iminopeptidase
MNRVVSRMPLSRSWGQLLTAVLVATGCDRPRVESAASSDTTIVTPDSTRLYVRRVGSGPEVVIVPGGLFFGRELDTLSVGRTLVLYDMRNRGRSAPVRDSTRISIQHDVADLETVRRSMGSERVALIGYSYLGLMVMLYAVDHPERVTRVAQIGPVPLSVNSTFPPHLTAASHPARVDSTAASELRRWREEGLDRTRPREFCELTWSVNRFGLVGDPGHVERLGPGPCEMPNEWPVNLTRHLSLHFATVQRFTVDQPRLTKLSIPVLTVHGTHDRNAPYGGGREWARTLRNARLLTVPGAAHRSWVDAPETVLPALEKFFTGEWPAGVERVGVVDPRAGESSSP